MSTKKSKKERVAEIQVAALKCFSRKGYHETTMDDIVAESGLTKGGIYWYFKSKRDIFLSLLDRHMREEVGLIKSIVNESIPIEKIFSLLVLDSLRAHLDDRLTMPLFQEIAAEATRDRSLKRKIRDIIEEGTTNIVPILERSHRDGEIRKVNYHNLSKALWALGYGLLLMYDFSEGSLPVEDIWKDFGDWLLHGIKAGKKS